MAKWEELTKQQRNLYSVISVLVIIVALWIIGGGSSSQSASTDTQEASYQDGYIRAAGHLEPGKVLYWDDGSAMNPAGTFVGFNVDRETISIQYSDGQYGTIRRDAYRGSGSQYYVKE